MTALVDSADDASTPAALAHAHAAPRRAFEMSSFPPHAHEYDEHGQRGGGQSRVDEDDLLDLLASDSFSLESRRDRDLVVLSSFLKSALPGSSAGGPAAHPPGPALAIGGSAAGPAAGGWNGWRPAGHQGGAGADGVAAPYGSPMSFASTASNMSNVPHAPSSSLQSAFSPPPVPSSSFAFPSPSPSSHHSFFPPPGSPAASSSSSAILSASPASRTQASPFATARHPLQRRPSASSPLFQTQIPQTLQQIHQGIRAPACSRERVPTLSSIAPPPASTAGGAGGSALGLDGEGWKSRLRSAARARTTRAVEETADDVMME